MKSIVSVAAVAAFASLAPAKELAPNEELGKSLYDSGIRHMEIMNHKEVNRISHKHRSTCGHGSLTLHVLGFLG
jgi:hypothetical protein